MCSRSCLSRAQRFVHQHQLRLEHQRPCQGHPLLLAAGQLRRVTLGEGIELHHAQHAFDPLADVGAIEATHRQRKTQVFSHGHVREQRVVLKHHADVALVRRHVVDSAARELDLARSRGFKPRQHHQAGGFARPGRPEQGQELAFANVQVEVFHNQVFAIVAFLHATKADQNVIRPSACTDLTHSHTFLFWTAVVQD